MKKKHIILCAGALSMAMLCGCEVTIQKEDTPNVTAEATQETVETLEVTEAITTPEATEIIIEDEKKTTIAEANNEVTNTSKEMENQKEPEETADSDVDSYVDLASLMTAIYEADTSSTDAESVAEQLKVYAFTYGGPSTSSAFESMANDWFDTMKDVEGKDIRSEFGKCFNTVTLTAQQMDEDLEFDLAYLNVINGIRAAIGE